MTSAATTGLRARKRREVRARIEEAAVFLVLRDGLEATTVDAISERADISPRTFFNYFESKDSAILGLHQQELTDELEHLEGDGGPPDAQLDSRALLTSVVRLLLAVMGAPVASRAWLHQDRLEVVRRHPQVLSGQFTQISARTSRLVEAIEQLVARTADPPAEGADLTAEAEVLLSVCGGALRVAVREWAARGCPSAVEDIERRATALVEQVGRKLA